MINPLRYQLAKILKDAAHEAILHIDKNSAMARDFKKIDVEKCLDEDIQKICENISFMEITRFLTLAMQLKSQEGKKERIKEDLKKIARDVMDRVKRNSGGLQIPESCREILFKL